MELNCFANYLHDEIIKTIISEILFSYCKQKNDLQYKKIKLVFLFRKLLKT